MTLTTAKVEFSQDDLSDTTPSWTDITAYVKDVQWWSGKGSDLDPPQVGGATLTLNNADRRFEPDYSAGAYYPNVKPLRRVRLTMTADGTAHTQGIYYVSSWGVGYPAKTSYSETTVQCTDGIGILSLDTLPTLSPPSASNYFDVVAQDNPLAHYPLADLVGFTMHAEAGSDGRYKGNPSLGRTGLVEGEDSLVTEFEIDDYARAPVDDIGVWHDTNQVTCEAVVYYIGSSGSGNRMFVGGPWNTGVSDLIFYITQASGFVRLDSGLVQASWASTIQASTGVTHLAMTWDGSQASIYKDGILVASTSGSGTLLNGSASEFLYVAGATNHGFTADDEVRIAHAAVYDYALAADRIAAHGDAALSHGYATQTTGDRVADLATNALWSTAGITGGQMISVAPRFQNGQAKFGEITLVAQAEQPYGLFYFDDSGNPAYQGIDYTATSAATFSDNASDVPYEGIVLVYDDDLYNNVTIARDGGVAQTREDAASEAAYMTRGYNQTGLILSSDSDADLVAAGVFDSFVTPRIRVSSITLNGGTQVARNQILTREIGDTIRVKRRTDTAEAIDVITRIIGKQKSIQPDGLLRCTWQLSRGIDASDAHWHLGITGFSELNSTTILA